MEWKQEKDHLSSLIHLMDLGRLLTSNLELDTLFEEILKQVDQAFDPDTVSVMLFDQDKKYLEIAIHRGLSKRFPPGTKVSIENSIAGEVVRRKKPVLLLGGLEGTSYARYAAGRRIGSAMSVPLLFKDAPLGVLNVGRRKGRPAYTEQDSQLLYVFASQIAVAVQNARLYESLRAERDRILKAQEEVRRELARDLHDGLVQLLAAMVLHIDHLEFVIGTGKQEAREEIEHLRSMVRQAVRDARSVIFGLRPIILETRGLVAALETYVDQLHSSVPNLTFHLNICTSVNRMPAQTQRTVFAILQEAIQNVRKHASAENVWVSIQEQNGTLAATVKDDGLGFELQQVEDNYDQQYSFGLLNMRERAELINARWEIVSTIGQGTQVRLVIPFQTGERRNSG